MNIKKIVQLAVLMLCGGVIYAQEASITKKSFDPINLSYPGLEKTNQLFIAGKYDDAAKALLAYYRKKSKAKAPDFSNSEKPADLSQPIDKATQEMADKALVHQFQPHKGYGYFDYGKDINWQMWPVKDNEVRWQLHRVKWWQAMALVYHATADEKYAKEWIYQYSDWVRKNPLGLSQDNDRFVWRPLEVSDRVQSLPPTFSLFVNSPNFSPAFLMEFLNSYHQQADYLPSNYAELGNHRLFEAQRTLFAGVSFPEFKDSQKWRQSGITVLNTEIKKQVFADGMQFELSPIYHIAAIDIFLKAYSSAQRVNLEKEFPQSYVQTIENMIMAVISITLPDYNTPMFGDSWITDKNFRMKQFASWSKVFPANTAIKYFATDGREGQAPNFLSKALSNAGFYTFRTGWDKNATVMVLKASPPGEFHAQPDNGTFELFVKGRNFTPDAGVFVYSGDDAIMKQRNWYRQTRIHSTLTLDNQNMVITKAHQDKWETGKNLDILTYTNPSYAELNHQRSVLFINQKYFLIIDKAIGTATGNLGVHFQLKEDSKPVFDKIKNTVSTTYTDGNNLLIQSLNTDKVTLNEEEGKVSYVYNKEIPRPAFVFEKPKNDSKTQRFVSLVYPYEGSKAPEISIKENQGNDFEKGKINLTLTINGKQQNVKATLYQGNL
ncbi:MAG: heparinase II/III family protein [Candidatus Pedobacter colombiensis]|uniref:Heparinase II/III family protein n=1 Tax=Candidatus Pedobacter colombiensis TaxID=3121371 RepID=A0AAJ5WC94_9SPHI|nr:heparin-sulfate lyase HepC [Pedobacter sp.]WEK20935.1 MAG: heparinase II/III family protein [Pedobacter sp.]